MTIELNTSMCPIVVPDTYGSGFQYKVDDDRWEDFKDLMVDVAKDYISEALTETDFAGAKLTMGKFGSPQYYNYETDWIDFNLEFDERMLKRIKNKACTDTEFFEYTAKYDSHDGFMSFYPVKWTEFLEAIDGNGRQDLAIAMYIMWQFEKEFNADEYQRDYLEDVDEYAEGNGYMLDYLEEVSE